MLRQRSVRTQYFGVWHALFKLSCVNGEKSENSSMIQQETRLRKQREEEKTIVDPTMSDVAESLSLGTDEEDVSIKIPPWTVPGMKKYMYIIEFCAYCYIIARKQVRYLICLTAVFFFCCQTDLQEDLQLKTWKSKFTQLPHPYFTVLLQMLIEFTASYIFVCMDKNRSF